MVRTLLAISLALALGAACSKHSTPAPVTPGTGDASTAAAMPADPTPPPGKLSDAELDALMRDTVAFFTDVADAITAAGSDCSKVAAGIERVVADSSALIERTREIDDDPDAQDRADAWMKSHDAELRPMFDRLFKGVEACRDDAAVDAALEKMSGS